MPTVQNWTDQNHQADPFMQGLAAPVEKWFLNILTESCEYSNWADRTIKQTHSGPCCVSVPSIREMVLKHPNQKAVHIPFQPSWQNHQADLSKGLAATIPSEKWFVNILTKAVENLEAMDWFLFFAFLSLSLSLSRARKIRAHSRILRLERKILRPENLVQSQLCA